MPRLKRALFVISNDFTLQGFSLHWVHWVCDQMSCLKWILSLTVCLRWELVAIVVLVCQGLIFENDNEVQDGGAILGFGLTATMVLIGGLVLSNINVTRRVLNCSPRDLLLPSSALSSLTTQDKLEIFQIFSEVRAEQIGNIIVPCLWNNCASRALNISSDMATITMGVSIIR
jgi:hypothetical protein